MVKTTLDKVEYDMPALLNYTAVTDYYARSDPSVLDTILLAPRKIFSGIKIQSEGVSGLYDKTSKV